MEIKDRIKELRQYLGLSQAQFATKVNKTPGYISLVETGRSGLSKRTIRDVCETFGVNEEWLLDGQGAMFREGKELPPAEKEGIGKRIRQIRKKKHLTMREFAAGVPCSDKQISNIENGKTIPTDKFLRKVAETYLIDYTWLISGKTIRDGSEDNTPELQVEKIQNYMLNDSVAREVVLEAMKEDRAIWLKIDRLLQAEMDVGNKPVMVDTTAVVAKPATVETASADVPTVASTAPTTVDTVKKNAALRRARTQRSERLRVSGQSSQPSIEVKESEESKV